MPEIRRAAAVVCVVAWSALALPAAAQGPAPGGAEGPPSAPTSAAPGRPEVSGGQRREKESLTPLPKLRDEGRDDLLAAIAELKQLVAEQGRRLEAQHALLVAQQQRLEKIQAALAHAAAPGSVPEAGELALLQGQLDAVAENQAALGARVTQLQEDAAQAQRNTESRLRGLGNFNFSGDVRLRYESFFQGGGFTERHRQRIRARFNMVGRITDEISGGLTLATGSLDDVNSTNQTFTGFYTRKPVGFDRFYVQYKPNWWKPLTLVGGKFAVPWLRTPLTFDNDVNPEGFSQTLSFDLKTPALENVTLVGFQLPFNEVSSGYDNAVYGGQVQTRWKFTERLGLRLAVAGINFHRADSIAVAVARGELRPSLANTNRLRTDGAGQVVGYASKYLYLDAVAALDFQWRPRVPVQVLFNFVNNTRATTSERSGNWTEVLLGRFTEARDLQFGYTFIRIERDAVLGAFNESDLRAATNVRNHRLYLGYLPYRNVALTYTLWLGELANPQENASLVPPRNRPACQSAPFTGCQDPRLKRMQLDVSYRF